ncbi:MAG: allantoinase AllB [Bacteroidetes bacterium]|nr:allantoinase AllB [Bacteroidota bacterium]MCW5895165.1 allantoinase AllB [Bacteroidota bacterium]
MFILRSRRIITPDGMRDAAIIVNDGRISDIINPGEIPSGADVKDVSDVVVAPGLVDPHVHINEPGRTEWEGFESATRAAAAGGITTLVDMPLNSSPVTTTVDALERKLSAAQGKLHVDCGFHGGLVPGNASLMESLAGSGVLGVKTFLIDSGIDEFPPTSEENLRAAMPVIAKAGLPLLVHAELQTLPLQAAPRHSRSYAAYLNSRPKRWENDAISMLIRLSEEIGCRVHIVHLSSSEVVPVLREAKSCGVKITAETCPHYLTFSAEEIPEGATQFKCAPPIREMENNDKLWEALREGVIDFIASDHSPCPPAMKVMEAGDFMKAWGGIASLQFGLSIMWTEMRGRGFSISDISRLMSANPATLVGLEGRKGRIAPGYDADFVVWNPDESFSVGPSLLHHRHKVTPYEGRTLYGNVLATYVRGTKVFEEGRFSVAAGRVLSRNA